MKNTFPKKFFKLNNLKKSGFTLVEIMIVVVIFSTMVISVIQLFISMTKTKVEVEAKETLLKGSYYAMETLANVMQNYSIDYEEYFNRMVVGCTNGQGNGINFKWGNGVNCDIPTYYGNRNSIGGTTSSNYGLYYCSSTPVSSSNIKPIPLGGIENGCYQNTLGPQSFGQYAINYLDVKGDADGSRIDSSTDPVLFDDDDLKEGKGPIAIGDNTNVKELYLISKDKKYRTLIRRALISSGDFDRNGSIDSNIDKLYTLQTLRLRGYDAGNDHKGDGSNAEGYQDGIIDTWVCDSEKGFKCTGAQVMINGKPYNLPSDQNDGWVNMLDGSISLNALNFAIYPVKDPKIAWGEENMQLNPYFSINFSTNLYGQNWSDKYNPARLKVLTQDLQTTLNTKTY